MYYGERRKKKSVRLQSTVSTVWGKEKKKSVRLQYSESSTI